MNEFISNINRCYYEIAEKPISKVSSSAVSLTYNYVQSFQSLDNKPFILGIPFKGDLSLILSAALLKNFFNEDYLLHSDEHFTKLQLKDHDRIKIFGMHTTWFSSKINKNGTIKLRQTDYDSFGETVSNFITTNIRDEWLPYIEKIGGKTKRIIKFHTFHERKNKHRVQRTALDNFLDYSEHGFGIPRQALYSKILLVSGRSQKAKTIKKLKEYQVHGDSLYNILVKNNGLEVVPDLKNFMDCFDQGSEEKLRRFISYTRKILEFVPEYDSSEILELLTASNIHSESFANNLEDFESYIDDNGYEIVQRHLNELNRIFPKKRKSIPENLRCIIIDAPSILNEYQNTIQGFLDIGIPIIILKSLTDDSIENSLIKEAFSFFYSKEKLKCFAKKSEIEVYDKEILNRNSNYFNQIIRVELFDDHGIEELILNLSHFFFNTEGFEDLKTAYWKIVYPTFFLYKNSPQTIFSDYKSILEPFFDLFNRVRHQLPSDITELIKQLSDFDLKNNKKVRQTQIGFNQEITINNQIFSFDFQGSLVKTNRLKNTLTTISFTGLPYREFHKNNILKALYKYCIPDVKFLLFKKEYHVIKAKIERYLVQHYFEDNVPFIRGIHKDFILKQEKIDSIIRDIFPKEDEEAKDVEINLIGDELHQKFVSSRRNHFISESDEDYVIESIVVFFSNEEWLIVPKKSKNYIASEEDDETITISKLPTTQIKKNDLMVLYDLDVSQLTLLAKNNQPLQNSLEKLNVWRNILQEYLQENSIEDLKGELENVKTKEESKANPSIQNLRNWCNDRDLIAPIRENLSLILRFADKLESLDEISNARRDVITFRNSIRKEIRKKLKTKLPKILVEKNPNSDFNVKIFGIDVNIKTREISFIDKEVILAPYHITKKIMSD